MGSGTPLRASERAYRQLRGEILDGVLAPGSGLLEVEQAERIGVSRTPLREAVARLIADGLVAGRSGRGFEVTEISIDSIGELYELRQALRSRPCAWPPSAGIRRSSAPCGSSF